MINTEIRLILLFAAKDGQALYSQQKQKQDDCGSDHELLIAIFRFKLKKVGKSTRPFMYDLNQMPYEYTVKVTNRFKGLDPREYLKSYGWSFIALYRRQCSNHPQEEGMQKVKMPLSDEALKISEKKKKKKIAE